MSIGLYSNEFIRKVKNDELMAIVRVANIRKKYREIRDRKIAINLDKIYNMEINDRNLAHQLQQVYNNMNKKRFPIEIYSY